MVNLLQFLALARKTQGSLDFEEFNLLLGFYVTHWSDKLMQYMSFSPNHFHHIRDLTFLPLRVTGIGPSPSTQPYTSIHLSLGLIYEPGNQALLRAAALEDLNFEHSYMTVEVCRLMVFLSCLGLSPVNKLTHQVYQSQLRDHFQRQSTSYQAFKSRQVWVRECFLADVNFSSVYLRCKANLLLKFCSWLL